MRILEEIGIEFLNEEAIALFRAGMPGSRPFRLGNNAGVTCFTTSAFFLWMLGYPDKAVARAEELGGRVLAVHPLKGGP